MVTSQKGIDLIKHFESLHDGDLSKIGLQPKMCPSGIWTVGYGHSLYYQGRPLAGDKDKYLIEKIYPEFLNMDLKQSEELLSDDIEKVENSANANLRRTILQHQFDALVSHTFNCGLSGTLYRLVNSDAPITQIKDWFLNHYITANGRRLEGLVRRRKAEFTLYSTGKLII